jgi:hypothetical protein
MVVSSSAISLLQGPASTSCGAIDNTTAAAARKTVWDARIEKSPFFTISEDGCLRKWCDIGQSAKPTKL